MLKSVELLKERAFFTQDMLEGRFMFEAPSSYDEKLAAKKWKEETPGILKDLKEHLNGVTPFEADPLEVSFKEFLEEKGLGMGAVMPNLSLAITGKGMGPSIFDTLEIIGKEEFNSRIDKACERIPA